MEDQILTLVNHYKQDFMKYWNQEKFKWQAIQWFQQHWDIDANDFSSMFEQATGKTQSLLTSRNLYPRGVIMELAKEFPSETKQMFVSLFDESLDLQQRMQSFMETASYLTEKHNNKQEPNNLWNNTYQNENSITTYLWLKYPDKYYIYKYSEFKTVAELLGCPEKIKKGNGFTNVKNGFELYDKICDILLNDTSIKNIISKILEEDCYPDKSFKTLTTDFGHYVSSYMEKTDKAEQTPVDKIETIEMEENKYSKYINLLLNNKNIILTGAPGTGKTYLAKQIAVEMLRVKDAEDLKGNEQFGFVQFHPSYDYTDFVEGLRPKSDGSNSFELRPGVFKSFCANAITKYETKNFDVAYEKLIASLDDTPLRLKTPQGNEFGVTLNSKGNLKLYTGVDLKEQGVLTRESLKALFTGMPVYKYWRGYYEGVISYLKEKYNLEQTENDPCKKYIFVIDEINRGEISKILGELFFSIDPGYRGSDGQVKTQYANMVSEPNEFDVVLGSQDYGHFFVPKNVYIIGTMNDIDRSVESMDFAMRRRFAWKEVTAKASQAMLDNNEKFSNVSQETIDNIKARMDSLNEAILNTRELGMAYQIGASYFLKYVDYGNFEDLWEYHLKGLLAEYLRGNADVKGELVKLENAYNLKHGDDKNQGQPAINQPEEDTGE